MGIDKVYTEDGNLEAARCERCIILFDVDNMITVGDWLLCDDCYEEL
jgi:NAD-dependent SIR2 family protein deacetylase